MIGLNAPVFALFYFLAPCYQLNLCRPAMILSSFLWWNSAGSTAVVQTHELGLWAAQ
jgi:hypothetical protein